jgi:hypothetical protein
LKKRTKKLLFNSLARSLNRLSLNRTKVFCFFFSKKKFFLPALRDEPSAPGGVTNQSNNGTGRLSLDDMRRSP